MCGHVPPGGGIFSPLFPFDYLTSFCLSFLVGGCIEVVPELRCRASGVLIVASISCPRRLTLIVGALRGAVMRSRFPNPTVPCCWKHRCAGALFFLFLNCFLLSFFLFSPSLIRLDAPRRTEFFVPRLNSILFAATHPSFVSFFLSGVFLAPYFDFPLDCIRFYFVILVLYFFSSTFRAREFP